jgi:CRP-like cAMP-binding protein
MLKQMAANLPLFYDLSDRQLTLLDTIFETCTFQKEQVIFEQGDPANNLYVLCQGEVVIRYKPYDGPPLVVSRIAAGGVFGWSVALGRAAYTSGAIAVVRSTALRASAEKLYNLSLVAPETSSLLMERLSAAIAERRNMRNPVLDLLNKKIGPSHTSF